MFPLTITLHNAAQLNAVTAAMAALAGQVLDAPTTADLEAIARQRSQTTSATVTPEKQAAARASTKKEAAAPVEKPKPEVAGTTSTATPSSSSEAAESAPSATSEPQATYEQVAAAITNGIKTNRDKVVATLTSFGVKRGSELTPAQFKPFLEALQ